MKHSHALTVLSMALLLSACGGEADSTQARGRTRNYRNRNVACCRA